MVDIQYPRGGAVGLFARYGKVKFDPYIEHQKMYQWRRGQSLVNPISFSRWKTQNFHFIRRRTRATNRSRGPLFPRRPPLLALSTITPYVFIFRLKLLCVRQGGYARCRPSTVKPKWKKEAAQTVNATVPRDRATRRGAGFYVPCPFVCPKKRACHFSSQRHLSSYSPSSSLCQLE